MRQDEAATVLLIRAVEEVLPQRIAPEALLEAHVAAGDPAAGEAWIVRRASYLAGHVLGAFRGVLARSELVLPSPWLTVGITVVVGLASNYLGPGEHIHVLWNPIVLLILWNLAVYATLGIEHARHMTRAPRGHPERPAPAARNAAPPRATQPGVLVRRAFPWFLRARSRVDDAVTDSRETAAVGRRFAVLLWPTMSPAVGFWLRRLLHLGAIGLAAGAVIGMYVRGLFSAYQVVWRSTFVNDPTVVAVALRALLGPAALVLGRPLPGRDDVVRLLSEGGDPAAPWIHLYAMSAVLLIVVPRALLAVAAARRLRTATADARLDLDAPYYRDLLQRARAVSPEELQATVRDAVRDECRGFADRLATLVCVELYDRRIAPRLRAFRQQGGTLRALEDELQDECAAFGETLERELPEAQQDLERALVGRVQRLIGDGAAVEPRPQADLARDVGLVSSREAMRFGDTVSEDFARTVSGVVCTAVAMVMGTVSGGFGHAFGTAVLVGVVHSGPLAWVLGALGGLVAAGAALWLGREKLREGVKSVSLPAGVLQVALWSGRYERLIAEGRERCGASVRGSLADRMEPLSSAVADRVWAALKPLLGELQRPRVALDATA